MCGLTGLFDRNKQTPYDALATSVRAMSRVIDHRGPDDEGDWIDAESGIAFAHRRLAIIDCNPSGHQPMVSNSGRFVIAYNGEIYNFREIREALSKEGHAVQGGSDTAVLLEACATWGVEKTLTKCIGMFAFSLWDRDRRELVLARDRLGIKPMYWARFKEVFAFGSTLSTIRAFAGWDEKIDRRALVNFTRHAYIPAPHTIFEDVFKLEPGHILTIPKTGEPTLTKYWDVRKFSALGSQHPFPGSFHEAQDKLEDLLMDAVGQRLVADVPLGAFLSGGVDSSTVVALMQAQSTKPVRSFSIGFHEKQYDEAAHAKAVAVHLGTDHTELYVTPDQALDLIPNLPTWYDEPFADSSQLPTLLLSQMTRQHVTVSLSGDGGDELFAGYNRYFWATRMWDYAKRLPPPLRKGLALCLKSIPPSLWNTLSSIDPTGKAPKHLANKAIKVAELFGASSIDDVYRRLISQWPDPAGLVIGATEHLGMVWDESLSQDRPDAMGRMQLMDMGTYLPDDILTKVDRASMAFSLEARVPLLDHRVVEFAWSLPRDYLVRGGQSKSILREVLYKHVPRTLIERPKMGFGVPIDIWLRGPLRPWAEELLDETRLRNEGYFNPTPIRKAWLDHLSGARNMQYSLWTILMFQSWMDSRRPIS